MEYRLVKLGSLTGAKVTLVHSNNFSARVKLVEGVFGTAYKKGDEITVQPYELEKVKPH